ncbi:phosphoserine phosphatase SerB [Pokkaliibacter sp. CJK22405]|uniref:phosphoserine phosphatase SerB n=1 Tax=Pokkaliibacter sp. CJK22405 TaxID=3384615 RepID=UPI0039854ABB
MSTASDAPILWRLFVLQPKAQVQQDLVHVESALKAHFLLSEAKVVDVAKTEGWCFSIHASAAAVKAVRDQWDEMLPGCDLLCEPVSAFSGKRKLACFDMDSTLIQAEVIDELAKEAGIGEQVAAITEEAMQGKIDFRESFTRRMALLKGLDLEVLDAVYHRIRLMDGAEELFAGLSSRGVRTAILSGGFTYFANRLKQRLGIDEIHANVLDEANGILTGEVVEPIVDAAMKAQRLQEICERKGFELAATMAVGDGANDLKMLAVAGVGVAFRAKPLVRAQADYALQHCGLDALLALFEA